MRNLKRWVATLVVIFQGCAPGAGPGIEGSPTGPGGKADTFTGDGWKPAPVQTGNLRVATFNIRNFPSVTVEEGVTKPYALETDREACLELLQALDFDVLGLQEIRDPAAFEALLADLSTRTGRAYRARFSENVAGNEQHLGIVVDGQKLALDRVQEHETINVSGTLRPGLSARVESVAEEGVDFSILVLHLASGDSNKRVELRLQQARLAAAIVAREVAETGDRDTIVLGDFNTAKGEAELPGLDDAFAAEGGLVRAGNASGCSSYWYKSAANPLLRPSLLDQIYLGGLEERDPAVPLLAGAHCAVHRCESFAASDAQSGGWYYAVSDHCPVYFEIKDADRD